MIQTIQDVSDCVALYLPHSLYLKPSAKFNVSVALPNAITGKTISNYEVMEKMRQMILPDKFSVLKVSISFSISMSSCVYFIMYAYESMRQKSYNNAINVT